MTDGADEGSFLGVGAHVNFECGAPHELLEAELALVGPTLQVEPYLSPVWKRLCSVK
jgi:hypothetical protein